jgi:hypothetical protein
MEPACRLQNISTAYFCLENPLQAENFLKGVSVCALHAVKCISYCTFIVAIVFFMRFCVSLAIVIKDDFNIKSLTKIDEKSIKLNVPYSSLILSQLGSSVSYASLIN